MRPAVAEEVGGAIRHMAVGEELAGEAEAEEVEAVHRLHTAIHRDTAAEGAVLVAVAVAVAVAVIFSILVDNMAAAVEAVGVDTMEESARTIPTATIGVMMEEAPAVATERAISSTLALMSTMWPPSFAIAMPMQPTSLTRCSIATRQQSTASSPVGPLRPSSARSSNIATFMPLDRCGAGWTRHAFGSRRSTTTQSSPAASGHGIGGRHSALWREMDRNGVEKNDVTYATAISACEKDANWEQATALLDQMEAEGCELAPHAYNACISACEKGMRAQLAMGIFERMRAKGVAPNVVTYSAMISACEKAHQWKQALSILSEMKSNGINPNVVAYSACISALSKGQQWEKALGIFRELEESGEEANGCDV